MIDFYDESGTMQFDIDGDINEQWLKCYLELFKVYQYFSNEKENLISKNNFLKSVDFTREKVTSGRKKLSQQEILTLKLERINKQLDYYKGAVAYTTKRLKSFISRIEPFEYRLVLILFYLKRMPLKQCVCEYYKNAPDLTENFYNYLDIFKHRKSNALKKLYKLNNVAYVPVENKQIQMF